MIHGRTISRSLVLLGSLACFLALAAPGAYGDGIVDGAGDAVPVDTSAVTEFTEDAPEVVEASPVEDATAVADEAAASVDAAVDTSSVAEPVEATTVETGTVPTSGSTATTSEVPVSDDHSDGDASAGPAPSGSDAPLGTTPASNGSATSGSSYPKSSMMIASSSVTAIPPAQRAALRGPSGPFVSGAGRGPEDVLDDLLGIGDSLGVDDVRGVQITSARGDVGDVPAPSSVPAPLALTGIAVGALAAIGVMLLLAGNGARAADSGSVA